jgi:Ca2+-transporting ATPase
MNELSSNGTPELSGLSQTEATARLTTEGPNELPSAKSRGLLSLAAEVLREPMILMVLAAGAIYFLLGDRGESLLLLASILGIVGISLYQSRRTARALEALRAIASPRTNVVRDGEMRRIAARELVRGDLIVLAEGDRVPADGTLLEAINLSVDESLVTGESVPVMKEAGPRGGAAAPAGDRHRVHSGTLVVAGKGFVRVDAIGAQTQIGRIGLSLQTITSQETRLQSETRRIVRRLAIGGAALCLVVAAVYGVSRQSALVGLLAGITVAMALIPEEFPVVLTVFQALGAWRLSQRHVLTRRVAAIEALGSATVLCVDKTGTLTANRMSVARLVAGGEEWDAVAGAGPLPETFHELVEFAMLASQTDPHDPTERAINEFGLRELASTEHIHRDWSLLREYPLSPRLLAMSRVWKSRSSDEYVIAAKGAPEAIADLCHWDAERTAALARSVARLAQEGLRVLAAARSRLEPGTLPPGQHDFTFEYLGLVGLADPVRPNVPAAIADCVAAGVRVVMITGDSVETARNIAARIGLPSAEVLTGREVDALSDEELADRVRGVAVFARAVPEHKLRLVRALATRGDVVAMTGDGVNDAPALKAADIGIAMGERGTDVAREAADIVLLDDDFSSIVAAVRLGRGIFGNLRKAMIYLLAVHVPIAGMSLLPVLLQWPLALLPPHILLLELIIDPAASIVFEADPPPESVMRRPPRSVREPLFSRGTVGMALLQGAGVLAAVFAVFGLALASGLAEGKARAMAFVPLVLGNLGLILVARSAAPGELPGKGVRNPALLAVAGGGAALLALSLALPGLRSLFRFELPGASDLAIAAAAGIAGVALCKGLNSLRPRLDRQVGL